MARLTDPPHAPATPGGLLHLVKSLRGRIAVASRTGGMVTIPAGFTTGSAPVAVSIEEALRICRLAMAELRDEVRLRRQELEQEHQAELQAFLIDFHLLHEEPALESERPQASSSTDSQEYRPPHLPDFTGASPRGHSPTYSVAGTHLLF